MSLYCAELNKMRGDPFFLPGEFIYETKSGGEVRGYVKEVGNRKELIAKGGRLIAFYVAENDQTILSGGRLWGMGDQLMSLLGIEE